MEKSWKRKEKNMFVKSSYPGKEMNQTLLFKTVELGNLLKYSRVTILHPTIVGPSLTKESPKS